MQNYKLTIQYDGSRYSGWQVQGNTEQTVQGKLQRVLGALDGGAVEVHGSGRTDAGVHARAQIANVRLRTEPDCAAVLEYCWTHLPRDIAVTAVEPAPERFHARLNARAKRYVYRIWNSPTHHAPGGADPGRGVLLNFLDCGKAGSSVFGSPLRWEAVREALLFRTPSVYPPGTFLFPRKCDTITVITNFQ